VVLAIELLRASGKARWGSGTSLSQTAYTKFGRCCQRENCFIAQERFTLISIFCG